MNIANSREIEVEQITPEFTNCYLSQYWIDMLDFSDRFALLASFMSLAKIQILGLSNTLQRRVLCYCPASIIISEATLYIKFASLEPAGSSECIYWTPLNDQRFFGLYERYGFSNPSYEHLFRYWFGFKEHPDVSMEFISSIGELEAFGRRYNDMFDGKIVNFSHWSSSLIIYRAYSGNYLLVNEDGKFGWWDAGEMKVFPVFDSVIEFVRFFDLCFMNESGFEKKLLLRCTC